MTVQFSLLPYMQRRFDSAARSQSLLACDVQTAQAFEAWRTQTRDLLKRLLGYDTFQRAPLEPQIFETEDKGDYLQEHVAIQTEPDVWMPMYILKPKTGGLVFQPIMAPHGHVTGGKIMIAGIAPTPEHEKAMKEQNADYGRQLVREGFIVFCPDARGFGERREVGSTLITRSMARAA